MISYDYETFYSSKLKYSLKNMIAEQYCKHELFDPYMVAVSDGKSCWAGSPKDLNWSVLDGQEVCAHNDYFEQSVTAECIHRGITPKWTPSASHCTANLTSFLCNRRSLDQAVEHLYGVKLDKSARGDANGRRWGDYNAADQKIMLDYARRDAWWSHKIWADHAAKWPTMERQLSQLTIHQGRRGVQINTQLLNDYIVQTHEMLHNTEQVIPWIKDADDDDWDDFKTKPTSSKCIAEQCRRSQIPCPPVKSDDEEGYELWEQTYGPKHPWIYAVGAWRSINKLYKTFLTIKERLRPDGTLPFGLKYFGAHTGRWSGDSRVNMQNMRKKPIFCNEHGLLETNEKREDAALKFRKENFKWPEWVRYAIDFRNLIVPRPGKKMIVSDLSQIEPRVLAWLAGDTAMLDMIKGGMAVYEAHARATMGWTGGKLKKENPGLYALAKVRILGLGYGAGWEKFIVMANTLSGGEIDLTKDDPEFIDEIDPQTGEMKQVSGYGFTSKKVVREFRDQNKKTVDFWKRLDEAFKRSVGEDYTMTLPSGRKMIYSRVRCETRITPNRKTGKPERQAVFTCDIGGKRTITYGGKLTENITQAVARDVVAEHMVRTQARGLENLFSVHDEIVFEVDQDVTPQDVEHEMSYCPDWLAGCPIGAEAQEVECYQK